jgi:nicotinate-nucleotide adenylyltransferase
MKKLHAIFGGNFDPIHYGHLYSAQNLAKEISIEKIIFLPNKNPPHREKSKTSIIDKLKMIKIAIHGYALFQISYLETKQKNFFYTIDTLKKIREKIGYVRPLCFIIGEDNLQYFNLWKDWEKILSYSHLLICPRNHKKKIMFN